MPSRPIGYLFTNACRRVLQQARDEAQRLGTPYVDAGHIVLALIAEGDSEPTRILTALGVKVGYLRTEVEASLSKERAGKPSGPDVPYTSRGKKVLEFAMQEAGALGHKAVDTPHLLLGAMAEGRSVAAQTLQRLGATLEAARAAFLAGTGPRASLKISIDDRSDTVIYEQIIRQIKEAIATGRIRPGDRLPTVRQLADELDIAPGTVARAYSDLETSGVVVTDGARGTFVALPGRGSPKKEPAISVRELLRPAVVAAYHLGASAEEIRRALEQAMMDIFPESA